MHTHAHICYFCKYMYIMFRYCLGMHYVYKLTWAVTNDKIIMKITVIIAS